MSRHNGKKGAMPFFHLCLLKRSCQIMLDASQEGTNFSTWFVRSRETLTHVRAGTCDSGKVIRDGTGCLIRINTIDCVDFLPVVIFTINDVVTREGDGAADDIFDFSIYDLFIEKYRQMHKALIDWLDVQINRVGIHNL